MRRAWRRSARVIVLFIALMSFIGSDALGVVSGKPVSIGAAPWTVVVRYAGQMTCTGVITDRLHVLTAQHCLMHEGTTKPEPASQFTIQAGISNFNHPLKSDHPQLRKVVAERLIPGYIAPKGLTYLDELDFLAHDLAVLTLSRPLDLSGSDARAADIPTKTREPSGSTRLMFAGFGNENPKVSVAPTGDLNEVPKLTVSTWCSTSQELCVSSSSGPCWGDSGAGLVEPGHHPTVVGILSQAGCAPGFDRYVSLTSPAVLRFVKASLTGDRGSRGRS
jgi:hypothetical protein